jgi:RHS repeat-associated protein
MNDAGLVLNQEMTNPWGKIVPGYSFADSVPNRYGLTGQEKDGETASTANPTGEMHYRARAYSPRQMRFLQNDPPVGRRAEAHHAYAAGRPVSRSDPYGSEDIHIVAGKAYWITEDPGYWADKDKLSIWIGNVSGGKINLLPEFGGAAMSVEEVRSLVAAHAYMGSSTEFSARIGIRESLAGRGVVKGANITAAANKVLARNLANAAQVAGGIVEVLVSPGTGPAGALLIINGVDNAWAGALGLWYDTDPRLGPIAQTLYDSAYRLSGSDPIAVATVTVFQGAGAGGSVRAKPVPVPSPSIPARVTIAELAPSVADDVFVNFGKTARSTVEPPTGTSYWFRFGDIKHLTPTQVEGVIGPLASAGEVGGAKVMRVAAATAQFKAVPKPTNVAGIAEYTVDKAVEVAESVVVRP